LLLYSCTWCDLTLFMKSSMLHIQSLLYLDFFF
jgi:hypothetical protein